MTKPTMNDLRKHSSFTVDDSVLSDERMYELFTIALKEKAWFVSTEDPSIHEQDGETSITFKGTVLIINEDLPGKLAQVEIAFKYPREASDRPIGEDFFKWAIITLPGEWEFLDYFPENSRWIAGTVLEGCTLKDTRIVVAAEDGDVEKDHQRGLTFDTDMTFPEPRTIFEVSELIVKGHIEPRINNSSGLDFSVDNGLSYTAAFSFPRGSTLNVDRLDLAGRIDKRTVKGDKNTSKAYHLFTLKTETKLTDPVVFNSTFEMDEPEISLGNIVMQEGETLDSAKMLFWMALGGKLLLNDVSVKATAQFPLTVDPLIDFSLKTGEEDGDNLDPDTPTSADLLAMVGASDFASDVLLNPRVPSLGVVFAPADKQIISVRIDISTGSPWTLVEDFLVVEQVGSTWTIDYPFQNDRQFTGQIDGRLKISDSHLMLNATVPDGDVAAWLAEDEPITIDALLKGLDRSLSVPPSMNGFALTALNFNASPNEKSFHFDGAFGSIWKLETGLGIFEIKALLLSLDLIRNDYIVKFGGSFLFADSEFEVLAKHSNKEWVFSAGLASESEIDISRLIKNIFNYELGESFGLREIKITELWLDFGTGKDAFYDFRGKAEWGLSLEGLGNDLRLAAGLEISQKMNQKSGKVFASLSTADEGFRNLQLTVAYEFGKREVLSAELILRGLTLKATLEKSILTFDLSSDLTFGDILTFIAGLVDPDLGLFSLESPWDEMASSKLALTLTISLETKKITVTYNDPIEILNKTVSITDISVSYDPKKNRDGFRVSFSVTYLSKTEKVSWDPINDQSPASPAPGKSAFELYYLGMGHHMALQNPASYLTVEAVVGALEKAVRNDRSAESLRYDRDSDWLIGARFSLQDMLEMSIIFNDPVLYGMLIELHGEKAKKFAGLHFEILYRRISDAIGVYHTELTLPDVMRHFNIGAVSVTLPVVALDIFTNGDFAVDVGFPWKGDWSRSARAEAGTFTGAGGFYFAKLSGATASGLPVKRNNGYFGLVLKFGLGLRLGLGRSYESGPLKAEFSLTMQGIFEGTLAWYHYPEESGRTGTELYHRLQASIQLVGRLYGVVDFAVIQIEVEVIVYAGVQLTIEAYKAIHMVLVAGVSVRAIIKVLFIKIHFSFELNLRMTFEIGSDDDTHAPWYIEYPSGQGVRAARTFMAPAAFALEEAELLQASNRIFAVWDQRKELEILFQPAFTEGLDSDRLRDPGTGISEVKGIALLFIENAIPADAERQEEFTVPESDVEQAKATGFSLLTQALLARELQAHPDENIALDQLVRLHKNFDRRNFSFEIIDNFLQANFIFNITNRKADVNATVFPMFPKLRLLGSDGKTILADFARENKKTAGELKALLAYYEGLKYGSAVETKKESPLSVQAAPAEPQISMATFVFADYFAMLTRSALKSAIEYMQEKEQTSLLLDTLFDGLVSSGRINQLAGIVSRFMLHGLRLPFISPPTNDPKNYPPDTNTYPLYELTGQQFTVVTTDDALKRLRLTLKATTPDPAGSLKFSGTDSPLKVEIPEEQKRFVAALGALTFTPQLEEVGPLPLYHLVPRHFSFNHRQLFEDQGSPRAIWVFPAALVSRLTGLNKDPDRTVVAELALKVCTGRPTKAGKSALEIELLEDYSWGTLVEFTVRRLPTSDGTALLKNTYLVTGVGGLDATSSSEDYLEEVIAAMPGAASASLLYENTGGALEAPENASFHLLRTNLAGGTGKRTVSASDQTSAADSARILWEAGKNEGGTYLHYAVGSERNELPETIFDSSGTAVLRLLIIENDLVRQTANPSVGRRHNCLVTGADVDPEKVALFAETTGDKERDKALIIKPGHVGFRITRRPMALNPSDNQWSDELDNLFQLLSYRLSPTSGFLGSRWGMPVGPAVDMGDPDNPNDDLWAYERVIPAYRFAEKPVDVRNDMPPASENPYAGISKNAAIKVEFEFQDIYGNHTTSARAQPLHGDLRRDDEPALLPMSIPVGYVDDIIGLKGWPGAILTYDVKPGPELALTLSLNLANFTVENIEDTKKAEQEKAEKLKNARDTYKQIYYQVHQDDLSFAFTTSLDRAPADDTVLTHVLDKKQFTDFVDQAYRYFDYETEPAGKKPVLPPAPVIMSSISLSGSLPKDLIFPVLVQIEMKRSASLVHSDFDSVDSVLQSVVDLAPFPEVDENSAATALRIFATNFEQAFHGLKLMSGNVDDSFGQPASLWAVQFARDENDPGIYYEIDSAEKALFFAPAPLANRLLSGEVNLKPYESGTGLADSVKAQKFNAVDLDAWGREFLAAVDAFLEADLAVPASLLAKEGVDGILSSKSKLAHAIADQVQPVLLGTNITTDQRNSAAELFKQQVLTHLESAYTIETIVQLGVSVQLGQGTQPPPGWPDAAKAPRISGTPVPLKSNGEPDYTLSTAKIPLTPECSNLTFLYNTPAPEKERHAEINLRYHTNALEFKISDLEGLTGYQDSSWLTFILPPEGTSIGMVKIPIPLRVFPTPPSLIMQRAEADMDSLVSLEHIREWQYTFIYEHQDAAQDAIETKINVEESGQTTAAASSQNQYALLGALANFRAAYPQVLADIELLKGNLDVETTPKVKNAVEVFAQLVSDVEKAWHGITAPEEGATDTDYYEIQTDGLADQNPTVTLRLNSVRDPTLPRVNLPGYDLVTANVSDPVTYSYRPKIEEEARLEPHYGVPNIPDFIVSIDNRDIIEHQYAWAEIWLSRNRRLGDQPTHPAFIYQTPRIRFGNRVTPLLVNNMEWHIEDLGDPQRSLDEHLEQLFKTLLPAHAAQAYDLRIGCGYAFALAEGAPGRPDLLVPLPVTLGPRLRVEADTVMLTATAAFRDNMRTAIIDWFNANRPSPQKAIFVFKLTILSPTGNLPLLQIEDLRLSLENITDLQATKVAA